MLLDAGLARRTPPIGAGVAPPTAPPGLSAASAPRDLAVRGREFQRKRKLFHLKVFGMICFLLVLLKLYLDVADEAQPLARRTTHVIRWSQVSNNSALADQFSCRNTVQGKALMADDRGRVCTRSMLLTNTCCPLTANGTELDTYTCVGCELKTGCCFEYEHCVSCCLAPARLPDLRSVFEAMVGEERRQAALARVQDQFELCRMLCRTCSDSISHGNRYRSVRRHCFLRTPREEDGSVEHIHPTTAD